MKRFKFSVVAFVFLFATSVAIKAQPINTATLRGLYVSGEPDCIACSFVIPHGCYVSVAYGADTIVVALPAPSLEASADCSTLSEGDCIEVTGIVGDFTLISGFTHSRFQIASELWSKLDPSFCE